jgi:hypothetical protein
MPVKPSVPAGQAQKKNGIRLADPCLAGSNLPLRTTSSGESFVLVHDFVQLAK